MMLTLYLFDMGLPMIFPAMNVMILALGPIIFIEAFALRSLKLSLERTVISVTAANFASTIIGIPVTWFLLYGLQTAIGSAIHPQTGSFADILLGVTIQSPWVHSRGPEYDWIVYGAGLFLLIPFFFASWLVEYWVIKKLTIHEVTKTLEAAKASSKIKKTVRNANLYSYALLAAFVLVMLVIRIAGT